MVGRRRPLPAVARLAAAARLVALALATAVVAGCVGGAPSADTTTAPHASAAAPGTTVVPAQSAVREGPTIAPSHSAIADGTPLGQPPVARLTGLGDGSEPAGSLGSYTWDGSGSDAPWVVGSGASAVNRGALLRVVVQGAPPSSWTAAWALVSGVVAGTPTDAGSGDGPVAVTAPTTAGDWTLRVTASFGPGRSATYFWHLAVAA